MAKEYGVNAGDEMLTAIRYAQSHQIPLEFLDMNAQKLFSNMLKSMSLSEKLKLFLSGIGGLFVSKKRVESELKKIENEFDKYIEQIGKKFPTIKRVLIDERNEYMAKKLVKLTEEKQKIVACVGDGHISGISTLLDKKNIEYEIIRLSELRTRSVESDATTASFSMEYKEP
jgi:pheromone shutdown protein TraB